MHDFLHNFAEIAKYHFLESNITHNVYRHTVECKFISEHDYFRGMNFKIRLYFQAGLYTEKHSTPLSGEPQTKRT